MIKTAIQHFSTSGRCQGEDLGSQLSLQLQGTTQYRGPEQVRGTGRQVTLTSRWKTSSAPSLEKPLRPLASQPSVDTVVEGS